MRSGGAAALSLMAGLPVFSPLIHLTFGLARSREELRRAPAIRAVDAAKLVGLYCAGIDIAHPRLTRDVAGGRRRPRPQCAGWPPSSRSRCATRKSNG
jgi:hypothetical protein